MAASRGGNYDVFAEAPLAGLRPAAKAQRAQYEDPRRGARTRHDSAVVGGVADGAGAGGGAARAAHAQLQHVRAAGRARALRAGHGRRVALRAYPGVPGAARAGPHVGAAAARRRRLLRRRQRGGAGAGVARAGRGAASLQDAARHLRGGDRRARGRRQAR